MINICCYCGRTDNKPSKGPSNRDAWAKLWKRLAKTQYARFEVVWKDYYLLRTQRNDLMKENAELRMVLRAQEEQFDTRLDTILEILMAPSEANRLSTIAKIKKRLKSGKLLASMRKANSE